MINQVDPFPSICLVSSVGFTSWRVAFLDIRVGSVSPSFVLTLVKIITITIYIFFLSKIHLNILVDEKR